MTRERAGGQGGPDFRAHQSLVGEGRSLGSDRAALMQRTAGGPASEQDRLLLGRVGPHDVYVAGNAAIMGTNTLGSAVLLSRSAGDARTTDLRGIYQRFGWEPTLERGRPHLLQMGDIVDFVLRAADAVDYAPSEADNIRRYVEMQIARRRGQAQPGEPQDSGEETGGAQQGLTENELHTLLEQTNPETRDDLHRTLDRLGLVPVIDAEHPHVEPATEADLRELRARRRERHEGQNTHIQHADDLLGRVDTLLEEASVLGSGEETVDPASMRHNLSAGMQAYVNEKGQRVYRGSDGEEYFA